MPPQVACAGHSAAAFSYTALFLESFAAAAKAGAFQLVALLFVLLLQAIREFAGRARRWLGLRWKEATHCASLALCVRYGPLRRRGHVLGLRVGGGPCGASLASCGRLCWPPP